MLINVDVEMDIKEKNRALRTACLCRFCPHFGRPGWRERQRQSGASNEFQHDFILLNGHQRRRFNAADWISPVICYPCFTRFLQKPRKAASRFLGAPFVLTQSSSTRCRARKYPSPAPPRAPCPTRPVKAPPAALTWIIHEKAAEVT